MKTPIIIAIDGFSSSGKSTMAKRLAKQVGYRYIDSGAMYRAVALYALDNGLIAPDGTPCVADLEAALPEISVDFTLQPDGSQHTILNGKDVEEEIRTLRVSSAVSPIAAIPAVRHAMTAMQKSFGKSRGIVMDGRDIGTVVFPDAELKVFVNASARTRAERRYNELLAKGQLVDFEDVLANVEERDHIDSTRAESPLRKADDAVLLDNSTMTIEEQDARLMELFNEAVAGKS